MGNNREKNWYCKRRAIVTVLMAFEDGFATGIDRVVRIDNQSSGKHIVSVEVRALRMSDAGGNHLIAHAVWYVRGKQTPFITTTVLLGR